MSTTHAFVLYIDTENYSGNFERPLGAYCTGCAHEYDHKGICKIAEVAQNEMKFGAWWMQHIREYQGLDEEYPPLYFNVAETPGWVMDRHGGDYRVGSAQAAQIQHPTPSLMSLSIAVDELPPQEVWEEFVQRAKDFCAQRYSSAVRNEIYRPEIIVFTGVRQEDVTVETQVKVTRKQIM